MSKGIILHVWGDYALFTRPEMKAERVSYDVMTPSAARAIVSAIYWKPQIEWVVDRIHVLKPIRWTSVSRNEVSERMLTPAAAELMRSSQGEPIAWQGLCCDTARQQRASLLLTDVGYLIEAHFNVLDCRLNRNDDKPASLEECEAKHISIFNRRAKEGQYFSQPYFGCREFPASFRLIEAGGDLPPCELEEKDRDFGYMLHDMVYRPDKKGAIIDAHTKQKLTAEPHFFRAVMKDGVIDIPPLDSKEARS